MTEVYYEEKAVEFYNNTVNLDMTELYEPFLQLVKEGGHILDAGCGSGRDTLYFLNKGYRVTAFDSSEKLVEMASKLTGQRVLKMRFQEMDFSEEFDGVWACASLLHVSREEIDDVMKWMIKAMKSGSVMYASFKYGNGEEVRKGRLFNNYDEKSSDELLQRHPELVLCKRWLTSDVRSGRENEKWLNLLLKKV